MVTLPTQPSLRRLLLEIHVYFLACVRWRDWLGREGAFTYGVYVVVLDLVPILL